MTPGQGDALLHEASVLKMRAIRLRTFGDAEDQRQAITLLRQAARKQLGALEAQGSASARAEVGARVEACGLFLEGGDPVRAAEQWARLPRWAFFTERGAAMLERVKPLYDERVADFTDAWRGLGEYPGAAPDPGGVSAEQVAALLASHGGVAELWWALSKVTGDRALADEARQRAIELEPSLEDEAAARRAWARVHHVLLRTVTIKMSAERRGHALALDAVGRIVTKFGDLLSGFVDRTLGSAVELLPNGATSGSFILEVTAQGLPPYALEELNEILTNAPEQADAGVLGELLSLLQYSRVRLEVALAPPEEAGAGGPSQIVIDATRRKAMLDAARAAALRTIDSRDVPQANDLDRVFRVVERVAEREALDADALGITTRQVA